PADSPGRHSGGAVPAAAPAGGGPAGPCPDPNGGTGGISCGAAEPVSAGPHQPDGGPGRGALLAGPGDGGRPVWPLGGPHQSTAPGTAIAAQSLRQRLAGEVQ